MKVAELRIGNWVKGNRPFKVLPKDILVSYNHEKQQGESRYLPIPLTEEILLKCGFELDNQSYYERSFEYPIELTPNGFSNGKWWLSIVTGYGSQPVTLSIKNLHQLQNLYFALTNEELEINL